MSSFAKTGSILLVAFLLSTSASLVSYAQSGPFPNIIQMNSNGAYLGIEMEDVTAANLAKFKLTSEKGVIVRSVVSGTPAEKAGLHEDDVILEYAGTPVWSAAQFTRLVQETPPGRKVDLAVSREGKRISLTAEIRSRNEDRSSRSEDGMRNLFRMLPDGRAERGDSRIILEPSGKPRLGLTLQPLSDQLAEHMGVPGKKGVLVASVLEGSPSAGKVRAGDVITAADGKDIGQPEDLTRIVRDKEGKMSLKLIRDKKELTVEVTLSTIPAPGKEERGLKL